MREEILEFYKKTSMYTNYGPYQEYFESLPDTISELMNLIRSNIIHRVTLVEAYKGVEEEKKIKDKIIVTCRYMSVLGASILKAKGISCRVRSGFAPYFYDDYACNHWIIEYYNENSKRWVPLDIDGEYHDDPTKK